MGDGFSLNKVPVKEIVNGNRTFIMGCAMISIMLFHQPFLFPSYPVGIPFEFFHLVGYHGVELFLFVSGLGIASSLSRNSIHNYYKNRLLRIVPACLFVGFCKTIVRVAFGFNPEPTQSIIMILTSLSLWYIEAILIYFLLAPVLLRVVRRFGFGAVVVFSGIVFLYGILIPSCSSQLLVLQSLTWAIQRLPVFMLGMYFCCCSQKMSTKVILYLGLVLYTVCFFLIVQSHRVVAQWRSDYVPYFIAYTTPALCALLGMIGTFVGNAKLLYPVRWFGIYSLEIYLCHEWFYHLFRHIGQSSWFIVPAVTCSLLFSLITKRACQYILGHR